MLEKQIEKELKKQVEKLGGRALKFSSPSNNGVPDRIVLYKGNCYFVELKREGESLRPIQRVVCKRFKQLGFKVYVLDSLEKVGGFINELMQ